MGDFIANVTIMYRRERCSLLEEVKEEFDSAGHEVYGDKWDTMETFVNAFNDKLKSMTDRINNQGPRKQTEIHEFLTQKMMEIRADIRKKDPNRKPTGPEVRAFRHLSCSGAFDLCNIQNASSASFLTHAT
jgi:hypothetical protein